MTSLGDDDDEHFFDFLQAALLCNNLFDVAGRTQCRPSLSLEYFPSLVTSIVTSYNPNANFVLAAVICGGSGSQVCAAGDILQLLSVQSCPSLSPSPLTTTLCVACTIHTCCFCFCGDSLGLMFELVIQPYKNGQTWSSLGKIYKIFA